MARRDPFEGGESPFRLEALEPFREAPATAEPMPEVAAGCRCRSGGTRRHRRRRPARYRVAGAREWEALEAVETEAPFLTEEAPDDEFEEDEFDGESLESVDGREYHEADEERLELEDAGAGPSPVPSTCRRDATVAVRPFAASERRRIEPPLLNAAKNARASSQNGGLHPGRSGVTADHLRAALRDYVDLDAVARAIADHDRAARDAAIAAGSAPFDAALVEGIHVFQKKCYLIPKEADGVAGPSTLDSLGLICHRLPKEDATNAAAKEVLEKRARDVEAATRGEFTARRWFQDFINPSFLGHRFKRGVHPTLVRQLRLAEQRLLDQAAYAGMTPVALGRALGFTADREAHAGGRPEVRKGGPKASFHFFGLAIDIRYLANPWIAGNPEQHDHGKRGDPDYRAGGNSQFIGVMRDATLLMRGQPVRLDSPYLDGLKAKPTVEIVSILRGLSDTLKDYLALAKDGSALRRQLEARRGTPGIWEGGETTDQAVARWKVRVEKQLEALDHHGNFLKRDPRRGFFDLPSDLVVALRDHAHMAWGAVDIGASQCGDLMHFDLRNTDVGRATRPGAPGTRAASGSRLHRPKAPPVNAPPVKATPAKVPPAPSHHVDPPGQTLYARIPVQSERTKSQVGIFIPEKFRAGAEIDLIVYLHGLLSPCPSPGPDIDRYWDTGLARRGQHKGAGPMALREGLNASGKNVILVAPSVGEQSRAGALVVRGGFDALVERVLAALRENARLSVAPRSVRHMVLVGHSKGGSHMRGIVTAGDAAAGRIKECWGVDCFYSSEDPGAWTAWARADRQRRRFYHYYLVGRKKNGDMLSPWLHTETLRKRAKDAGLTNVILEKAPAGENHCSLPMAILGKRLQDSAYLDNVYVDRGGRDGA